MVITHREWYLANKAHHVRSVTNNRKAAIKAAKDYVFHYLSSHPCVDCPEGDPVCLDFDHVRGTKQNPISRMVFMGMSVAAIQKEIEKCEVRCSNCHRKRHAAVARMKKATAF